MRLLLYNIRYGVGAGASMHMPLPGAGYILGNQNVLPDIVTFIKSADPDIVGLIEVDSGSIRSRKINQAEAIAAELGMSESRFSRFFRKATGNTFTDFVNRIRISRACQLLMDTDQQINLICYEVGFNNVANFNRRFLESKGMTPSEFRKQSLTRFRGAA